MRNNYNIGLDWQGRQRAFPSRISRLAKLLKRIEPAHPLNKLNRCPQLLIIDADIAASDADIRVACKWLEAFAVEWPRNVNLLHGFPLELVGKIKFAHVGLLASNLGKQVPQ